MKELKKFALGFWVDKNIDLSINILRMYEQDFKERLHDIHFAHYENSVLASGRFTSGIDEKKMFNFLERAVEISSIRLTLLMNYIIEKDYEKIMKIFKKYYDAGIRSVVIADLGLIKRIKQKYPDVYIQGSCLSYRLTEEDLEEEANEGVELHNPGVDIIRMPGQIKANYEAGFKQKILFAEGCFHQCPHEKPEGGHRWSIARNKSFSHPTMCENQIYRDARDFFLANWVTIQELKRLEEYIEVVKLPRGQLTEPSKMSKIRPANSPVQNMKDSIESFIHKYDNNLHHDVLDFNAVSYKPILRRNLGYINSEIFDEDFFKITSTCNKRCRELNCSLCDTKLKQIKMSQPNNRVLGNPDLIKIIR
jgi:hypothetical protein